MDVGKQKTGSQGKLHGWKDLFSRWHLGILVGLWLGFSMLTFIVVSGGLDNASEHPGVVALSTAGTILGPMTGAISRDFQGCCLEFSLSLLPYGLAVLTVAVMVQVVLPVTNAWMRVFRLIVWTAGLFIWFGSGIISLGHALS